MISELLVCRGATLYDKMMIRAVRGIVYGGQQWFLTKLENKNKNIVNFIWINIDTIEFTCYLYLFLNCTI